uniref:BTB domain-containing protein n=1 Tax=Monopterus albus TaxID=43700 RepID=A0A3Q3JQX1_MONAL
AADQAGIVGKQAGQRASRTGIGHPCCRSEIDSNMGLKTFTHSSTSHSQEMLEKLNALRNEGHLCDVTIRVQDKLFQAHKVVLACCSEFFRSKLVGRPPLSLQEPLHFIFLFDGKSHASENPHVSQTAAEQHPVHWPLFRSGLHCCAVFIVVT